MVRFCSKINKFQKNKLCLLFIFSLNKGKSILNGIKNTYAIWIKNAAKRINMKSIYQSNHFTEKKIIKNYNNQLRSEDLVEENTNYTNAALQTSLKEIILDGMRISIRNVQLSPPFIIDVEHDFPFMKLHFELEGGSNYTPKNKNFPSVNIPSRHYNLFFLPKVKGTLNYDYPTRRALEINFKKKFLKKVFGNSLLKISNPYGVAIEKNIPYLMYKESKPITPNLWIIIQDIINCNFEGAIKKVYLESKVTEILTILFNELQQNHEPPKQLDNTDYLKIVEAEAILRKDIKNPPTISELALLTGLNQYKLKQNFKKIYHAPIFTYITNLRMEKAIHLIVDKGYTVSEAAYKIGYKNPQHFTAAFKRKYNYLPSSLKS